MAVMGGTAAGAAAFGALADLIGVRETLIVLAISTGAINMWLRSRLQIITE
jgi:hypothetical protein